MLTKNKIALQKLQEEIASLKESRLVISEKELQYLILERQIKMDEINNPDDFMSKTRKNLLLELLNLKREFGYISGIQEEKEREYINYKYQKDALLKAIEPIRYR